jgi:hypothetical protein
MARYIFWSTNLEVESECLREAMAVVRGHNIEEAIADARHETEH